MTAMVFNIVRAEDNVVGFANIKHFVLGPGEAVSCDKMIEEAGWSLYGFDQKSQCALFVDISPEIDLAQSAFVYADQHKMARRLLSVPFEEFIELAERVREPKKVIFIFSTGRCGSTLVSTGFNRVENVWCLSEPDAYTGLIMSDYADDTRLKISNDLVIALIRAATKLLFRPPAGVRADVFAVKFRSQCFFQAELYRAAFPDAAFVFLYRDMVGWANSFYQMVQKFDLPPMPTKEIRMIYWQALSAGSDVAGLAPYVDIEADDGAGENALAPVWAYNMDEYMRQLQAGVPYISLRYNELNADREASLVALFEHCGLPGEAASAALGAFEQDSQAGTKIAQGIEVEKLDSDQREQLRQILAKHPRFSSPDAILPDIYRPAEG